ncbi:capsular biosynthesis protein [Anaerococcus sp. WCA-380-WT-2B]|uniref:Capsular biosynthesis protein n=1 Tax=Anaerococcus porci TaxID=2652269 RepID=A0A6N7VRY9_9FIRM|nr:capsular biosynthesis protein [Anaerococcus porci]MSS77636.1 capsular biosynthesis protein [Anaerococcus porci]
MKKKKSILSVIPKALVFGIIVGIGFYFLAPRLGLKSYRAQAKILTTDTKNIEKDDKTAYTYAETINSDAIKNKVIENLKLNLNPAELDEKMDIDTVSNTHIININVKDSVKLRAEDIADEYADLTVSVINQLYNANAKVLDYAYQNGSLLKPSAEMTTRVGLAAFVTYFILSSLRIFLSNSRIEDEIIDDNRKVIRKVVFEEDNDNEKAKDYEDKEEIEENKDNEEFVVYEEVEEDKEDEKTKESVKIDEFNKVEEDYGYRYKNTKEDKEENVETREIFINDGKKYMIISDIPKYEDGDLDV